MPEKLYLTGVLVCHKDDVMWFEGSGANTREGMSVNCLLRQKGIQGNETRQRKTDTDQECAKQCLLEGYYRVFF